MWLIMGVERLDNDDKAAADDQRRPGDRAVVDHPQSVDSPPNDEREIRDRETCHIEYRALVETAYRVAARRSWDEHLPAFQRAWADHQEKWPSPERSGHSPQTDAQGAWLGAGDRRLDPEVNSEVDRGCRRISEIGEYVVTPAIRRIEAEDPDRNLIGLEHRLKSSERIKEKVARALDEQPELSPQQALSGVPDAIRFTFCYDEDDYAAGVRTDLEMLGGQGFELAKPLKNSWESDQYKGINTQWREPESGQLFEVQFHTSASFEAKQLTHAAYERIRTLKTSDREVDELEHFQRQVCAKIPVPPGASAILEYPRREHDG